MELDLIWILIGLPAAFGLGWLASRLDLHQLKLDNRQAPRAYFKGLNFLLNEQQDKAIDAFIEAVQNDPDTSELHFALGNLFRRRGEYERAVRVHEHLLSRGDLSTADRHRAQNALAKDYVKAGLLDRADRMAVDHHFALLSLEQQRVHIKGTNPPCKARTAEQVDVNRLPLAPVAIQLQELTTFWISRNLHVNTESRTGQSRR